MQHLHYNGLVRQKTILLTIIISTLTLSSIIVITETQDQLLAKKSSHGFSPTPSSSERTGSSFTSSGNSSADNGGGSRKGTTDFGKSAGSIDPTHCDQPGYPSCYSVGYSDGQANPGTSCPGGHSVAYCEGYNAGSRAGSNSLSSGGGSQITNSPSNLNGRSNLGTESADVGTAK